ncbi:MAG TPA: hypothetical protein PLZ51_25720, partial [Aggregatilineales bacterium]|nr:hypothetical protein [Aggregatilineales bacterium]
RGAIELIDGRILSWSEDRTLCLWDSDGAKLNTLSAHKGWVLGAIQLTDGRIVSWGTDENLYVWDANGKLQTSLI